VHEQGQGNREDSAHRAHDHRPHDDGQEGEGDGQADRVADEHRLDDRLQDEVGQGVDDDHGERESGATDEQRQQRGRHHAEEEPDVRDVVGQERHQAPQERERDPEQHEGHGVHDRHEEAENRRHHDVAPGVPCEAAERCPEAPGPRNLGQAVRQPGPLGGHEQHRRQDQDQRTE
jgi:hypothetical protein